MRLIVHGATGRIGRVVAAEAAARGHTVTAVVRGPGRPVGDRITVRAGDVLDTEANTALARDHDAVVSAVGWTEGQPRDLLVRVARSLLAGAGGRPLLVVGGAGTLLTDSGRIFLDTPGFPPERRANSLAHTAALEEYRASPDVPWTYLCPPAVIDQGPRTGSYRLGAGRMLTGPDGPASISVADFAAALVDLLERPAPPRGHLTVAR